MINDLDNALKKLLEQEVEDLTEESQNVYFDPPDDTFAPVEPAVDLFLYDVRENRDLRSNQWQIERNGDAVTRRPPPVRVECSYLITAWAGDALSEHLLLSKVMRALLRHPTIPAEVLQGSLEGQEPPLPAMTLQPGRLQSMGEFWQALGGKPKAALNYTVTIGVDVHAPLDLGPAVTDVRISPPESEEGA
jgi:hypothetical protein